MEEKSHKSYDSKIVNSQSEEENNYTDVYLASIPSDEIALETVTPIQRQQLINNTTNKSLQKQRYFVWKLLEHALQQSFGLNICDISFTVDKGGKWHCNNCYFSLSHCDNAVAVAVSKTPVGVDIENVKHTFPQNFYKKILTSNELEVYNNLKSEEKHIYLMESWCAKESIFKSGNGTVFSPDKIEINNNTKIGKIKFNCHEFCYSVCCDNANRVRLNNVEL